ncbi:MAG TPA: IclR family transcriptional regulator [Beijerinckiaceae bacterium]|nr:IclR family transcriptional regulator [Beijerinckiaceae bacterium]
MDRQSDTGSDASLAGEEAARSSEKRLSSVAAAIALLKAFSEDEVDIGVSTLAKRLGMAKSTVHRLATTLVSEGMLEQNPENGKYRLGITLFSLGALVRRRMDVSTEAKPYLFDLRETTGETVHLAILDRTDIMYVYNLESTQAIRMRSDIGVRKPAYCTAEGLAMLAFQPSSLVDEIIAGGLQPRTAKTNTDPRRLREVLAAVRERGYAVEDEESEAGMRCVAAPVRNATRDVVGAVGIAGPVQRLPDDLLASFAPHVVRTAEAISVRLGYRSGATF